MIKGKEVKVLYSAKVPEQMVDAFLKAQSYVEKFFTDESKERSKGTIQISGQRFILLVQIRYQKPESIWKRCWVKTLQIC